MERPRQRYLYLHRIKERKPHDYLLWYFRQSSLRFKKRFYINRLQNPYHEIANHIAQVTDNDYILNLVANKQTMDLETAWDILNAHDFSLAKIPQYVYDALKSDGNVAVISTEKQYFWRGSLSNVQLLDKHLNTIETFDD